MDPAIRPSFKAIVKELVTTAADEVLHGSFTRSTNVPGQGDETSGVSAAGAQRRRRQRKAVEAAQALVEQQPSPGRAATPPPGCPGSEDVDQASSPDRRGQSRARPTVMRRSYALRETIAQAEASLADGGLGVELMTLVDVPEPAPRAVVQQHSPLQHQEQGRHHPDGGSVQAQIPPAAAVDALDRRTTVNSTTRTTRTSSAAAHYVDITLNRSSIGSHARGNSTTGHRSGRSEDKAEDGEDSGTGVPNSPTSSAQVTFGVFERRSGSGVVDQQENPFHQA